MTGRVAAVLVVPNGTYRPEPLAEALRTHHPSWRVGAIWCGDPQLRPVLDGAEWLDEDRQADELAIVSGDPHIGEWRLAMAVTAQLLDAGADDVVVLWVGATAVLAPIDALVTGRAMTLVSRAVGPLPDDCASPSEAELIDAGPHSTTVAAFGDGVAARWIADHAADGPCVGHVLVRGAQLFDAAECSDAAIGVGAWRWTSDEPALLDLPGFDARTPWTLDASSDKPMRIGVLGHDDRQAVIGAAIAQLVGGRTPVHLPGGALVDDVTRRVVARSGSDVPAPWSSAAEFRAWLAPRYWRELHRGRADLLAAFPDPSGASAAAFRRWSRTAFTFDDVPLLLEPPNDAQRTLTVAARRSSRGANLVGYFDRSLGLGEVARRLRDAVDLATIPRSIVVTQRTDSPVHAVVSEDSRVEFTNSVCVVTADQFPFLAADYPELFAATERMIGYWFWELEHIPLHMRRSIALVDEIWAATRFVTDAFAAVASVPVRHVPIPIGEPQPSTRLRNDFPPLAGCADRTVFLVAFDHLSVTERKNPVGAIEAFRRAFKPGEGPILVIKTMNGDQRWPNHLRVLAAADWRDDIRVWDETLDRADQMALVAAVDCLVSLHRSEGLGLHLAEAMWLNTPVIATRYSGNLDFMDDDNSLLIDADLVHVEHGEGVYPATAKWAEPDIDQAAAAMRRIAGDPALRQRLAAAGRRTMERQPSLQETGRLIGQLLLGGG